MPAGYSGGYLDGYANEGSVTVIALEEFAALTETATLEVTTEPTLVTLTQSFGPLGENVQLSVAVGAAVGWSSLEVQVAWDDGPLVWSPVWSAVTEHVISIGGGHGRASEVDDYQPGTLELTLDDRDGRYNPLNASGPHAGKMVPYRQVRVLMRDSAGSEHSVWRGWVEPRGWLSVAETALGGATATVRCFDILGLVAQPDLAATDSPVDADDELQARYTRVLDQLGAAALAGTFFEFVGAPVQSFMGPTSYGTGTLEYLQRLARSDGGAAYARADGVFVLEQRLNQWLDAARTTPQGVFADTGVDADFEVVAPDYAHGVVNVARYSREGGDVQEAGDAGSVSTLTGLANIDSRTDLLVRSDPDVHARAELTVAQFADPRYGPARLVFDAAADADALDQFLARDVRDRIAIEWAPPGLTSVISECVIEHVAFDIPVADEPNVIHVTWTLSDATRFDFHDGTTMFTFDDDARGFDQGDLAP